MTTLTGILGIGLASFALSAAVVPAVRRLARGQGLYEQPVKDRWHRRPVAKLGGVGMALVFFPVAFVFTTSPDVWRLLSAALALFALGLFDDLRPIRPSTKFFGQMIMAAVFLVFRPTTLTGAPLADLLLVFLWFVGITNAFNLLDNIDGLAAGVTATSGAGLVALLLLSGSTPLSEIAVVVAALAGTALGFLIYNWQPASIFMGDGGSHLIGSIFAGATLLAAPGLHQPFRPAGVLCVLLLLVPCTDTAVVMLTRALSGRSPFSGGRDHLSHRLVAVGWTERQAVSILCGLSALGALASVGLLRITSATAWVGAAAYAGIVLTVAIYLGRVPVQGRAADERLMLPGEAGRYRGYEILLDTAVIALAYYIGLIIRFRDPVNFSRFLPQLVTILPLAIALHLAGLWLAGKYRKPAGWNGLAEASAIVQGTAMGSAATVIAVLYLTRFEGYSRQVFVLAAGFVLLFLAGARLSLHALDELIRHRRPHGRPALIYGGGTRGAIAVRELLGNPHLDLAPVGVIDDDPGRRRTRVEGIRVVGALDELDRLLTGARGRVAVLIVAAQSLPRDRFDRVCVICAAHGVEVRRLRFSLEDVEWREHSEVVRLQR